MHTDAVTQADERLSAGDGAAELSAPDVEAVVLATRLLVAISAQSVAAVDDIVTLPQLRVLVMVSSRGPLNLGAVAAEAQGVASVKRDAGSGSVGRRRVAEQKRRSHRSAQSRPRAHLGWSGPGGQGDERGRRAAIARILDRMPASRRRALVPVLRSFAAAGGEVPAEAVWSLGWTTSD